MDCDVCLNAATTASENRLQPHGLSVNTMVPCCMQPSAFLPAMLIDKSLTRKLQMVCLLIQELEANDDELTLTLKMALESDLRLRFYDTAHFSTWKAGFEALLQLLFSPG